MQVFLKAQLSSLIATVVDFGITIIFIEVLKLGYVPATINGALVGAAINFFINRSWSFKQEKNKIKKQGLKYGIVWLGSIGLNVGLSNLIIVSFNTPYLLSKTLISAIIGITFNYTLQKYYVFSSLK